MVIFYPPGPDMSPILYYDAPVDEKTMEVRKQFKVDPETGYPEHYSWRGLAKLGKTYTARDLYTKIDQFDPVKDTIYGKVHAAVISCIVGGIFHQGVNFITRVSPWQKLFVFPLTAGSMYLGFLKWQNYSHEKSGLRNKAIIEYWEQHPDRFKPIQRHKLRETLYPWFPQR